MTAFRISTGRDVVSLLATADLSDLEAARQELDRKPQWCWLRRPECGLVMVRSRTAGTGQAFNLGEITVTRCTLQTNDGHTGCAYVTGRNSRHAELAALLDAALQTPDQADSLRARLLPLLSSRRTDRRRAAAAKTAPTKVELFTMVRGKDET